MKNEHANKDIHVYFEEFCETDRIINRYEVIFW